MGVLGFQIAKVAFEVGIGLHFMLHTVQERLHYPQHHVDIPNLSAKHDMQACSAFPVHPGSTRAECLVRNSAPNYANP